MKLLIKFIDLILYGNFWIAAAALAMSMQTEFLLTGELKPTSLWGLIFFATLLLYALHHTVGLEKVKPFKDKGRYSVIARFKHHILFYAAVSAMAGIFLFFSQPLKVQLGLIAPAVISLAYVLPFLSKKRRLRDLHFIKIFLIAATWAWITVFVPAQGQDMEKNIPMALMCLERMLFVFAITLPFDIRDLKVDRFVKVKTIPSLIGIKKTKLLALFSLAVMLGISWINYHSDAYSGGHFLALSISAFSTGILIFFSDRVKHDYYFTGLLDGTMIVQFLLVFFVGG